MEALQLGSTAVKNVANFCASKSLKHLKLPYSQVTGAGTRGLELIPTLEDLDLSGTNVSGVTHLAKSKSLKRINLCGWKDLTQDDVQGLMLIPTLESLLLRNASCDAW